MKTKLITLIFVGIVTIPGLVVATTPNSGVNRSQDLDTAFTLDQVLDHAVKNTSGVKLGEITSLVFKENGKISHVVLSHGGFMGINSNKVLLPWDALIVKDPKSGKLTKDAFRTDISESQLSNADKLSSLEIQRLNIPKISSEFQEYRIYREGLSSRNLNVAENQNQDYSSRTSEPDSNVVEMKFNKLDKNSNGFLEKSELSATSKNSADFDKIDNDRNGKISKVEYSQYNSGAQ